MYTRAKLNPAFRNTANLNATLPMVRVILVVFIGKPPVVRKESQSGYRNAKLGRLNRKPSTTIARDV